MATVPVEMPTSSSSSPSDTSSCSLHFGQLVWAKLASAPFWPAVIFSEENQDWLRHKGKSDYVLVFFFGETAERNWIQSTRILPFIGKEKLATQRDKWRRKNGPREEQRLSLKDKADLNKAIQQMIDLARYSLQQRITMLKDEWWYWEEKEKQQKSMVSSTKRTLTEQESQAKRSKIVKNTMLNKQSREKIFKLIDTTQNDEPDDIICLTDYSSRNDGIKSPVALSCSLKQTSSVCFYPLTLFEEETIISQIVASTDNSFSACRLVAEREYALCVQTHVPDQPSTVVSEHWFYLFVFRHSERFARVFGRWANDLDNLLQNSPLTLSPMHASQIRSLIVLFKHLNRQQ